MSDPVWLLIVIVFFGGWVTLGKLDAMTRELSRIGIELEDLRRKPVTDPDRDDDLINRIEAQAVDLKEAIQALTKDRGASSANLAGVVAVLERIESETRDVQHSISELKEEVSQFRDQAFPPIDD